MKSGKTKLGERIKEYRKASGLSQEQLAEMIGIEQKHVSRLEVGKSYPTIDRLEKISTALNVPMGRFFDCGDSWIDSQRVGRIETMIKDLDKDYNQIVLKFSQIMKEFNDK
jgi:transcriptional regulator with XRE-family HTH domain